jgi:peptide subunit release factor RF-3
MFEEEIEKRKTFAVIAHPGCGKDDLDRETTLIWWSYTDCRSS